MIAVPPVIRLSIPSVPEFKVWITTDGEETPLYGIKEVGSKTICFVESKTGQPFAIHFADDRLSRSVGFMVELHMYGQWQRARVIELEGPQEFFLSARRDGPTTERPLVFEDIKATDNEELACTDEAVHRGLGILNLTINRWVDKIKKNKPSAARDHMFSMGSTPVIHEDSKKANVSHAISFGDAQPAAPTSTRSYYYDYNYVDQEGSPFHEFEFRCRSRDILEAEGLVSVPDEVIEEVESSILDESIDRRSSEFSYSPSPEPRDHFGSTSDSYSQDAGTISDDSDEEEDQNSIESDGELAELEYKLAQLELQSQMLATKRRMVDVSAAKQLKRGPVDVNAGKSEVKKEVKLVKEENDWSTVNAKKDKGKEREVIVLSDSD